MIEALDSSDAFSVVAPAWFTAALAQRAERGEVVVDGALIAFRTWGRSRAGRRDVLLVHGGAAHARWWDHLAPLLATHRRVVAIDLSGHGDSAHRDAYSVERWVDELRAVLAASGLTDRPVVVGHSLGGLLTTALARTGRPAISGAVIVDSPLYSPRVGPSFGRARVYRSEAEAVSRFRPVPAQSMLPWIAEHIAATSVREQPGGWGWKFDPAFMATADELPTTVHGLRCPAVLIAGEHGILSSDARRALDDAAEVVVVEVPDAGHAIMLDQPLALLAVLRGVLAGWESAAA